MHFTFGFLATEIVVKTNDGACVDIEAACVVGEEICDRPTRAVPPTSGVWRSVEEPSDPLLSVGSNAARVDVPVRLAAATISEQRSIHLRATGFRVPLGA